MPLFVLEYFWICSASLDQIFVRKFFNRLGLFFLVRFGFVRLFLVRLGLVRLFLVRFGFVTLFLVRLRLVRVFLIRSG